MQSMATGGQKRKRSERVAALELSPGQWERAWASLRRRDVLGRIGLALATAVAMAVVIGAWDPPFAYQGGFEPDRDIVARVSFDKKDDQGTELARELAKDRVRRVYTLDSTPLEQLRAALQNTIVAVTKADTLDDFGLRHWLEFQPPEPPAGEDREEQFQEFRATFTGQENLDRLESALADAFKPFETHGIWKELPEEHGGGNQQQIRVYAAGRPEPLQVAITDVLIGDGTALKEGLRRRLGSVEVADRVFAWVWPQLREMSTLKFDAEQTKADQDQAAAKVEEVLVIYTAGETALAKADEPLTPEKIDLLRREYDQATAQRSPGQRIGRTVAVVAVIFAMFLLCGVYMRYRQRGPLGSWTRLSVILALAVITVALACWGAVEPWKAELIPVMIFGMTMAIVYRQELALLLCGVLAWILVLAVGHGLHEFLLLLGVSTAANVNMGSIRSRSKLIYVGLFAGGVAVLLDVGLGLIDGQFGWQAMLGGAALNGLWAVAAGFVMTGLLPFIERLFGVLTDLSLLELGDVAHPVLQELIRRAPSTYNHSVTVGSIAEAAAESIDARGLLCRVGAYFHDIGKMLKPGYFVENQGAQENRHETLVPAMSSLVIVAHIKDGADLARQHHLPQPIIDLIEQHHGTMRVGFFYERATQQKQSDPNGGDVDESTYRYPGPKPQTKEAGVLMLADCVESASRTLVDPTPKRIESLIRELAERRLRGGQFDESGLTLRELRTIERSMVKSLIAIYHGRLKYPDQKTA